LPAKPTVYSKLAVTRSVTLPPDLNRFAALPCEIFVYRAEKFHNHQRVRYCTDFRNSIAKHDSFRILKRKGNKLDACGRSYVFVAAGGVVGEFEFVEHDTRLT